jgi:peptidoglycan/xylan/chitin deacetylase (PgdA/CDA1 family)
MNGLTVLTYHAVDNRDSVISVSPALFEGQMQALASNNIAGISLRAAFEHLVQTGRFPANSVVLSFDDGYTSLFDEVLPVLQPLGFSGTAFLVYDMIGLNAWQARSITADIDRDLMGWKQITELMACGFEIGSHTLSHADLTRLDVVELKQELGDAREKLQQNLQTTVNSLAYPCGNVNPKVKEAASEHYRLACTTRLGRVSTEMDRLMLPRIDAYYLQHPKMFLRVCKGGLDSYLHFRQQLRDLKQRFTRT